MIPYIQFTKAEAVYNMIPAPVETMLHPLYSLQRLRHPIEKVRASIEHPVPVLTAAAAALAEVKPTNSTAPTKTIVVVVCYSNTRTFQRNIGGTCLLGGAKNKVWEGMKIHVKTNQRSTSEHVTRWGSSDFKSVKKKRLNPKSS